MSWSAHFLPQVALATRRKRHAYLARRDPLPAKSAKPFATRYPQLLSVLSCGLQAAAARARLVWLWFIWQRNHPFMESGDPAADHIRWLATEL